MDDVSNQLAVAQNLPPDLMLLKMENESIMAVARAAPRDPMKIVNQLKALIDAYPAAADEAIYSKPVGTVTELLCHCGIKYEVSYIDKETTACPACDAKPDRDTKTRKIKKFAEGLSIRAAESIRSIFGYTRLATTCDIRADGSAKITGVLVDYAAGNVTSDERIVSPWYKAKGGQMVKTPEDRFIGVVVKAEKSKLRRDVILDSTPAIVKALFRDECEKKMLELVAPEVIEQKILPAFKERGISVEHLEKIVGRSYKLGWREQERLELRKILTALNNEETTVAELLADLDDKPANGHTNGNGNGAGKGPVKGSDLTGAQVQRDPTGAHADLGQEHRRQASAVKTEQSEQTEREPGDDDEPSTQSSDPTNPAPEVLLPESRKVLAMLTKPGDITDLKLNVSSKLPEALRPEWEKECDERKAAIKPPKGAANKQQSLVD